MYKLIYSDSSKFMDELKNNCYNFYAEQSLKCVTRHQ